MWAFEAQYPEGDSFFFLFSFSFFLVSHFSEANSLEPPGCLCNVCVPGVAGEGVTVDVLIFPGIWNSNLEKKKDKIETFIFPHHLGLKSLKGNVNNSDRTHLNFQCKANTLPALGGANRKISTHTTV